MAPCRGSPWPNISPARGMLEWGRWSPNVKPRGAVDGKGCLDSSPDGPTCTVLSGPPCPEEGPILKSWCNGNPAPPLLYTLFYRGLVVFGSSHISQTPLNPTPPRKKRGGQIWVQDDFSSSRNSRLAATPRERTLDRAWATAAPCRPQLSSPHRPGTWQHRGIACSIVLPGVPRSDQSCT